MFFYTSTLVTKILNVFCYRKKIMSDYQPNLLVSVALFIMICTSSSPINLASQLPAEFTALVSTALCYYIFSIHYDSQDFLLSVSFQLIAQSFCLVASETLFFHLFVVNYFLFVWLFF